jgi:glycosyltransferase involved in cell wall biosynthesis
MMDQAKAYFHYIRAVRAQTARERYDLVFGTSSRLMTAVLAASCARRTRAPLYLDLRDIFVDTIGDVLAGPIQSPMKRLFAPLEAFAVRSAIHVNLVSEGFRPYFESRFPSQRFSFHTNGIDDDFLDSSPVGTEVRAPGPLRIVYAGNMGEGQGLHVVIPKLARALGDTVHFRLIGDGGRRAELERALQAECVRNVEIVPPMSRPSLLQEYASADVLFLHLNAYTAFEKVLPSKIFEYAALGKPVWAGVGGYAARFLREEVSNSAVFAPCDVEGAVHSFGALSLFATPRPEFIEKFQRRQIMASMASDLLRLIEQQSRNDTTNQF